MRAITGLGSQDGLWDLPSRVVSFQDCGPRSLSVQNNEGGEGGQAGVG